MSAEIDFPDQGGRFRARFGRPCRVLRASRLDQVLASLSAAHGEALAGRWVIGFVAYEAAPAFDAALRVRAAMTGLPLVYLEVHDTPLDGVGEDMDGFRCGPWRMEIERKCFDRAVAAIRADIGEGRFYQTNLSMRLRADFAGDARAFHHALRRAQPDGYSLYLDGGDWQIASLSPELFFDWVPTGRLVTRPMKGTASRYADPAADQAAAGALRASAKEQAENLMIVDLLRNDLARVASLGTVQVPALFELQALPTAWQMSSSVECMTRPGIGLADIFQALFPCGSVTGAPKVAAMQSIVEHEMSPRGVYCGAIGLIRPGGHATFNVGIRTVMLDGERAQCGVGAGITFDSRADAEFDECLVKRRFLLRGSADFELIETLRLEHGQFRRLERHLERLGRSARHFGFEFSERRARQSLADLAASHVLDAWRVRLLLDRHGGLRLEAHPLEAAAAELLVALATAPMSGDSEFLRHKTTARDAYALHAPAPGVFDTLLWNEHGEITEFTKGNVIVALDGRYLTPPLSCGLLPGVHRQELLDSGTIEVGLVSRDNLRRATQLWFINSLRGRVPAHLVELPVGGSI